MKMDRPPTIDAIRRAASALEGKAVPTPVLESPLLNERLGGRILVKAEPLQRTGSFKFRGAYNRISAIPERNRAGGVVAYSSGNHAQGVAAAAQMLGMPAVIVMPADAPAIKAANTRALGAEVVFYDRVRESREDIADALLRERRGTLVRPYDDPLIIAGQGTVGLEMAAQVREREASLDALLCPCGGGGLIGGTALALAEESPQTAVYAVEPEDFDDTARSLAAGERLANEAGGSSLCDALLAPEPGELTFALNSRLLAGGLTVSDDQVKEAMKLAFETLKVVVEPGGAVALAALLGGAFDARGKTVGLVFSGGNVDADIFAEAIA